MKQNIAITRILLISPMFSVTLYISKIGSIAQNTPSINSIIIVSKIKAPIQYVVFLQPITVRAYLNLYSLSITGEAAIPVIVKQYDKS